jgi:hypothetical protein
VKTLFCTSSKEQKFLMKNQSRPNSLILRSFSLQLNAGIAIELHNKFSLERALAMMDVALGAHSYAIHRDWK